MVFAPGASNSNFKHGLCGTPEHHTWLMMRDRCHNPNSNRWRRYGGRGITVCKRWDNFLNFLEDMGPRPPGMTLERKNNDGHYRPSNCVWATPRQQGGNRVTTKWVTFRGKTMCAADWARYMGLTYNTFMYRLSKGQLHV